MKITMRYFLVLLSANFLLFGRVAVSDAQEIISVDRPGIAPVLEEVTPAVVNISVTGRAAVPQNPLLNDPYFRRFFDMPDQPQTRPVQSAGSGVIIDAADGYILTNHHVVKDAEEVTIVLQDRREIPAKVIGSDAATDIALLQIDAAGLKAVPISDSDTLRVGDYVAAIGNPFGIGQTVTTGIVSALSRQTGINADGYEDFIQTDAAINSGNSGGALVNLKGELVGINTAIIAPGGGNVGIGFAIPSIMMNNLVNQLIEFGEVKRGVLGITGYDFNADLAKTFELDIAQGAFVQQVIPDSSADKGGLKYGDVVTHVDGIKISSFNELRSKVSTKGAGSEIELTVNRSGDVKKVVVVLGAADKPAITAGNIHPALKGATFSSGKAENGVTGVQVTELEERSPASMLGLEQNDIIIGVNRTRIQSVSDLRDALEEAKGVMALNVVRGNSSLYILIR